MSEEGNEHFGIYSKIRTDEPIDIDTIADGIEERLQKILTEVEDVASADYWQAPIIDFTIVEQLTAPLHQNLMNREVNATTALNNIEPLFQLPNGYTIDRATPSEYIDKFYDKDVSEYIIRFMSEGGQFVTKETSDESVIKNITKKIRAVSSGLYSSALDTNEIANIFTKVDELKSIIDSNKDVIDGSVDITTTFLDKMLSDDHKEILKIVDKVRSFVSDYESLSTSYLAARFPSIDADSTVRMELYRRYESESDLLYSGLKDSLKEIHDNNYIEKLKKYQDKHVFKGELGDDARYSAFSDIRNDMLFRRIIAEEKAYMMELFDLENIHIKNISTDEGTGTSDASIASILRSDAINFKRHSDLDMISRLYFSVATAGSVQPGRNDIVEDGSYILRDSAYESGIIKNNIPSTMEIGVSTPISDLRRTIRHELSHIIDDLLHESNVTIEQARSEAIKESFKYDIEELISTFEYLYNDINSITSNDNLSIAFRKAFNMDDMSDDDVNKIESKLKGVVDYLTAFVNKLDIIYAKINTIYDPGGGHGSSFKDIYTLTEGVNSLMTSSTFEGSTTKIFQKGIVNSMAPLYAVGGRIDSNNLEYSVSAMNDKYDLNLSEAVGRLNIDINDSPNMLFLRGIYSKLLYLDTTEKHIRMEELIHEALGDKNKESILVGSSRRNTFDVRDLVNNEEPITEDDIPDNTPVRDPYRIEVNEPLPQHVNDFIDDTPIILDPASIPIDEIGGDDFVPVIPSPVQSTQRSGANPSGFTVYRPPPISAVIRNKTVRTELIDLIKLFRLQERFDNIENDLVCK